VTPLIHGLLEGWWMFYDTFWALIWGFALSGVVQAFVSRRSMVATLGDHRASTVVRASELGIISSSCSYAASALAKSIYSKGADFTSSMIFMFASTNLVVELGFVLVILLGWQFAAAEFIGGFLMIALLAFILPRVISPSELPERSDGSSKGSGAVTDLSWREKIRSRKGWVSSAGYTIGDLTMLRTELVIGFLVAGLASTLIPVHIWRAFFLSGHGVLAQIENAIVGPFIAFISFVCSVGNVPLAAALWKGGITFGGSIAFIFADLISLPLVMIYAKYYGRRLAIKLTLIFWAVMSLSGLLTEIIFRTFGAIPERRTMEMGTKHFGMNATTFLNGSALIILLIILWLNAQSRVTQDEFAKDLVCGMQVRISDAPPQTTYRGKNYYFCMQGCCDTFLNSPEKYLMNR
jgi:uncharacterized protein